MGKKRTRKTKVSKGIHSNVAASTLKAVRNDVSEVTRALHKLAAWKKGKNPWVTVPGTATNARLDYHDIHQKVPNFQLNFLI